MRELAKGEAVTPIFRASYPNVFKARMNKLKKREEFSVVALLEPGADLGPLKKAMADACEKRWGTDKNVWPKKLRSPIRANEERAKEVVAPDGTKETKLPDGYLAGGHFINLTSKEQPAVLDQTGQRVITEPSKFYAGCYARARVFAYAYDEGGNQGVSFFLNNLQFAKDGEPFSGRPPVEEAFAPIEGAGTTTQDATSIF